MARDPDDEALSWGDENDPTYVAAHPAAPGDDDAPENRAAENRAAENRAAENRAHESLAPGDDLERDIPVVDPFSSSAVAPPLPPAAASSQDARSGHLATERPDAASRPPSAHATTSPLSVAEQAEAAEDAAAESDLAAAEKETAGLSSAGLITFGIFGGIFLLYTVGWLVTYIRNPTDPSGLAGIVQNAQNILAIAAPALWFIVTLLVGAKRKVPVRVIWLIIGVVVLLPWPFLTGY